jgi:hypothetical protein
VKASTGALLMMVGGMALLSQSCGNNYAHLGPQTTLPASVGSPTLLANFENKAFTDNLGQPITFVEDTYGITTQTVAFVPPTPPGTFFWDITYTAATPPPGGSTLAGGTPGAALRMNGYDAANVCCNWPYSELLLGLNSTGSDITKYAPGKTLTFSYKAVAGSPTLQYEVALNDLTITNYNWFCYRWNNPADGLWHSKTINFPPDNCGMPPCACVNCFTQSAWGPSSPTNPYSTWGKIKTNVTQVVFEPFTGSVGSTYDLTIDDVWFN